MGVIAVTGITETLGAVEKLGPTAEARQEFAKTWLGSSLGQTVVLVGMVLSYVMILVLLWRFAHGPLSQMKNSFGNFLFFALIFAPVAIILAFNAIPALVKGRRERRLKRLTLKGAATFKPGYFRLHPYSSEEAERFKRNDGADVALLDWVRRAPSPVLYLSGPSGSGKSSLIAASLEPGLRADGWAIVNARMFGDPLKQILHAFAPNDDQPPTADRLYAVIAASVSAHRQTQPSPLLLSIDQFEEYLIIGDAATQAPLQALLNRLVNQPIDGLKLLLSLRSDYQALIFQQDLPPAKSTINWFQLAPYRRSDAEAFLQNSGKEMTSEAIDALFRGLDRIEETRGLYRPITLNMVGLVLERMGQTVEGDPEKLIQTYLKSALITGDTKDYVRPLLEKMISDAGTKIPQSRDALSTKTGLEPWKVEAAMADLESRGLVRPFHGIATGWEIAHDFLARLLGQMLGRVKQPLFTRARPYSAPLGLALWMATLGFGVQYGFGEHQAQLRSELTGAGWNVVATGSGQFRAVDDNSDTCPKAYPARREHLVRSFLLLSKMTQLDELSIGNCYALTSLKPLSDLKSLTSLVLTDAASVTDLKPLSDLKSLTSLHLYIATGVTSVEPLRDLKSLTDLTLSDATGVTSLEPLRGLKSLTGLNLAGATGVTSLEPLKGRNVDVFGASAELLATMR